MVFDDVPFNKPFFSGKEVDYIRLAIEGRHIFGDGVYSKKCQHLLEKELGVLRAMLTPSGTHALEMAAMVLDIRPGDEVIIPSFTFVSTANAFFLRGARPVFVDSRGDTLNLDENLLESLITSRTKAIVAVHYAGVSCEMDRILKIAGKHGIPVVEDNAHGLFGKYKNRFMGSLGCLSAQSFHATKNFTCGEGGALLINEPKHMESAEIIREMGTNRKKFFMGEVDKYSWVGPGSSFLLSDILAAYLYAQLEIRKNIQSMRKTVWDRYHEGLNGWAEDNGIRLPYVPEYCEQAFHMFYLVMPSLEKRQTFIDQLKKSGIMSVFHYTPLHASEMGRKLGYKEGDCPVAERVSDCLVRLPFYNGFEEPEQDRVIETIKSIELV